MRRISRRLVAGLAAALVIAGAAPLAAQQDQKVDPQREDTRVGAQSDQAEQAPRVSLPPTLTGFRGQAHLPKYRTFRALQPITWIPTPADTLLDESPEDPGYRTAAGAPLLHTGASTAAASPAGVATASSPTPAGAGAELDEPRSTISLPPAITGARGEIRRAAYSYTATVADPTQPSGVGDPRDRGKTIYGQGPVVADPSGLDPEGWTPLVKSADTRVIYVSSSEGSDLNSGLSVTAPVKTIAKGKSLVRMGYPDWLLLKRGDEWEEVFGHWNPYGRSEAERMVVGAYGEGPRPLLRVGGEEYGLAAMRSKMKHVIFCDLSFWAPARDPSQPGFDPSTGAKGIYVLGAADDVIIEGCKFRLLSGGIIFQDWDGGKPRRMKVRRNLVLDSYSTTGHSQGMFVQGADDLLIEENIFDHNGWHDGIPAAEPTMFNHNIYLSSKAQSPLNDVVVRGNILSNASALGIKIWAGAPRAVTNTVVEDNVFFRCPDGLRQHADGGPGSVNAVVRNNVFTEIGGVLGGVPQSWGAAIGTMEHGVIVGNIFAHKSHDSVSFAVNLESAGEPYRDIVIAGNVVYRWNRGMIQIRSADLQSVAVTDNIIQDSHGSKELQQLATGASGVEYRNNTYHSVRSPEQWFRANDSDMNLAEWTAATGAVGEVAEAASFADPMRTISSYDAYIGGLGSSESFVGRARTMERMTWDSRLTGGSVVSYFKEGFEVKY